MTRDWRLAEGGAIDRTRRLAFTFDGVSYEGCAGDTLASALLANGVHLVGRSFKYHRPRGIYSAGVEEPNALVQLATGAYTEPNTRATTIDLYEGLVATSQNCWPSVRFDVGEIANLLSPILPAGFYYKTFKWPPSPAWWMRYEHFIRHAAGMGRSPDAPDPARYDRQFAHCDILVVGSGPAGLAAASTAAEAGASVIVCEQATQLAAHVAGAPGSLPNEPSPQLAALRANPGVTLLARTTAFGYYDANLIGAVEHLVHDANAPPDLPRQRLWLIRAGVVVLASGATERPIAYGNNDLPGTLLAGAAATYVQRYAVRLGRRAVVFTNNDDAYDAALALHQAGIDVAAVIDTRSEATSADIRERVRAANIATHANAVIARAYGRHRVSRVDVASRAGGTTTSIDCDVVAVSGGYSPVVHLFSQARGRLRYDASTASFLPDRSPMAIETAGAVNGRCDVATAVADGEAAARRALARIGSVPAAVVGAHAAEPTNESSSSVSRTKVDALWTVPDARGAKCFVDLQDDVTVRDVALARREGYQAVEHLKRYTTLGMGTDQGKTSNVVGIGLMGDALRVPMEAVGTTTFRPPYTPVTLGALVGPHGGPHAEPARYTAVHAWHAARGARFVDAGLWKRPHSYPRAGESEDDAANREARNVRENVGVVDVSTLGKIELQGRDVAEFLNRIYINRWDNLQVGRCRYGVMLREDGIVRDDGTTSRLDRTHYLMTTTTANAVAIMQTIERLLQIDWPDLDVYATSVTEQWTAVALSGPRSRDVLARVVDIDVSNEAFPFLAVGTCGVRTHEGVVPGRLFRMSYSGELAYEIHVPARSGLAMWEAVLDAGDSFGIMPYGTEAMSTLRIEKGHVVIGAEIDGRTTAADLGMEKLVNPNKWCIGKPLLARPALDAPDRWQLVGLTAEGSIRIPRGAKIVANPDAAAPVPMQGHVTSWCFSPNLDRWIALALVSAGRSRHGETVWATSPLAGARARVTIGPPTFIDPAGERLRA